MNIIDTVAEAIWRADVGADIDELYPWDSRDDETTKAHYRRMAQAAIDVLRPTITTSEQLQQCPRGSVVLAADDRPFRRWPAEDGQDYWTSGEIALPALLLWHPSWVRVDRSADAAETP